MQSTGLRCVFFFAEPPSMPQILEGVVIIVIVKTIVQQVRIGILTILKSTPLDHERLELLRVVVCGVLGLLRLEGSQDLGSKARNTTVLYVWRCIWVCQMLLKAFTKVAAFTTTSWDIAPVTMVTYQPRSPEVQLLARSPGETPTTSRHKRQLAVF